MIRGLPVYVYAVLIIKLDYNIGMSGLKYEEKNMEWFDREPGICF